MDAISGIGSATSAWPAMRSARADGVFSLTDADSSASTEQVTPASDGNADNGLGAGQLDAGLQDLMPPPSSTLEFARQYGENDLSMPPSSGDGASSSAGSSTSDVDQALNTLVDLVMKQYGQGDASVDAASSGSLSVSA